MIPPQHAAISLLGKALYHLLAHALQSSMDIMSPLVQDPLAYKK